MSEETNSQPKISEGQQAPLDLAAPMDTSTNLSQTDSGPTGELNNWLRPNLEKTKEKIVHAISYGDVAYNGLRTRISQRRAEKLDKKATEAEDYADSQAELGKTALSRIVERADKRIAVRLRRRANKHTHKAHVYGARSKAAKAKHISLTPVSWKAHPADGLPAIHWQAEPELPPIFWRAESKESELGTDRGGVNITKAPETQRGPLKVVVHKRNPTKKEREQGIEDSLFDPKVRDINGFYEHFRSRYHPSHRYRPTSGVERSNPFKGAERSNPFKAIDRRLERIELALGVVGPATKDKDIEYTHLPKNISERYHSYFEVGKLRQLEADIAQTIRDRVHAEKDSRGYGPGDKLSRNEFEAIRNQAREDVLSVYFTNDVDNPAPPELQAAVRQALVKLAEQSLPKQAKRRPATSPSTKPQKEEPRALSPKPADPPKPASVVPSDAYEELLKTVPNA